MKEIPKTKAEVFAWFERNMPLTIKPTPKSKKQAQYPFKSVHAHQEVVAFLAEKFCTDHAITG
jgi:hypothetical protein